MPQEKYNCANLLKHGPDVQEKHYNFSQAAARDARMANIVDKMVSGDKLVDQELAPQIKRNLLYLYFSEFCNF